MKKFLVKDFIAYNNPCFSCGDPINLQFGVTGSSYSTTLRPVVTPEKTEVNLKITYIDSLTLWINHKTNRVLSSNNGALTNFLSDYKLNLISRCDRCMTSIESQFLDFNLLQGYVNAVGLAREHLMVHHNDKIYALSSSFIQEKSFITVTSLDKVKPLAPFSIETPLLPLHKLQTRERLIEKINTYMIFS